ncbi:MAG: hypothetical protein HY924_05325 [Elusimicrobia bacterium]|nr:hypothetical protein [Elusimicrobiota bacterium]
MKPLLAAAFLVLAAPCAGQTVVRPGVSQVPEVRLNVGSPLPVVNPAAGSGALGTTGGAMSFGGSVLSLRGGQIREAPPELPLSAVPSLGSHLPAVTPAGSLGRNGAQAPALESRGGVLLSAPGQAFQRQALDPEDPAMGPAASGKLSGASEDGSAPMGFEERAAVIGRHLKDAGKVSDGGSEFAEGFGRRLADLMLGTLEHRSAGLDESGDASRGGSFVSAQGPGLSAPGSAESGREPAAFESAVESLRAPSPAQAGSALPEGFPGIGRILMEVSELSLGLSQVFPRPLQRWAASAGSAVPAAVPSGSRAGASRDLSSAGSGSAARASASMAAEPDYYPGGFGSFMASVGGSMAAEGGSSGRETGAFPQLEAVPAPLQDAGTALGESVPDLPRSFRSHSREPGPSSPIPLSILSYALLPLFLAGLELRSRL